MDVMEFVAKHEKVFAKWERHLANLPPEQLRKIAGYALTSLETLVSKDSTTNIFESVTGRKPLPF